eukprot:COSAG01_NODE_20622_length_944_cov_2.263905_1_plen_84_part_00
MDGGHGAREHLTCFTLGILWWLFDLDFLAEAENEGGWSKLNTVEKLNGASVAVMTHQTAPCFPRQPTCVPVCLRCSACFDSAA